MWLTLWPCTGPGLGEVFLPAAQLAVTFTIIMILVLMFIIVIFFYVEFSSVGLDHAGAAVVLDSCDSGVRVGWDVGACANMEVGTKAFRG